MFHPLPLSVGIAILISIALSFDRHASRRQDAVPAQAFASSESFVASSSPLSTSSSSSLGLIVRVSPLLKKTAKKPSYANQRSYRSPVPVTKLFLPYEPSVTLRGTKTMLFFASDDDPFSVAHETVLRDLDVTRALQIRTYRVDTDLYPGLKIRYGVVVPDTFVLLDASAERVQSWIHPNERDLRSLLSAAAQ